MWEKSVSLLADTVDAVLGKVVDLYAGDDELAERTSEKKILDLSLECMIFLAYVLDLTLYRKRPDIRESIIKSMYQVIAGAYDLEKIDNRKGLRIWDIIDDRMSHYAMIARSVWRPAGFWWFGCAPKLDPMTQCLILFGDYITYFREYEKLPVGDDIEPAVLVDPLDCESLAVPFIVFQDLAPKVKRYIAELEKIVR